MSAGSSLQTWWLFEALVALDVNSLVLQLDAYVFAAVIAVQRNAVLVLS